MPKILVRKHEITILCSFLNIILLHLGLYAGDSCSRSRETLSQSLRFLDSVGYHEPEECRTEAPAAKLLCKSCSYLYFRIH